MSHSEALTVTDRFVQAVVWGEHVTIWELFSPAGREHVLQAGSRRGLDPMQAQRIRQGTSPQQELDAFLTGLLQGLRVDFSAVPIDQVRAHAPPVSLVDGTVKVSLTCPANFGDEHWAAGSVTLSQVDGVWLVDGVHPVVSRSE